MGFIQQLFRLERSNDSPRDVKTMAQVIAALDACAVGRVRDPAVAKPPAARMSGTGGANDDDLVFGTPPLLRAQADAPLLASLAPVVLGHPGAVLASGEYQSAVSVPWLY